ncbi:MAG: sugar-binding transcriptional regulator [Balneolaceae bacterium]|nr:MAG: sugar-binding transcriptional regulator [Balneolaceae bacterium]
MNTNLKLRLATKVAQLYYEKGLLQKQIARQLYLSQATISRLLKLARDEDIVRTHVSVPLGVYNELENRLEETFGLKEAIVAEAASDLEQDITKSLGSAAAFYLESTLSNHDIIGISSWSITLLAMVKSMQPVSGISGTKVVQILGGLGNPAAETHANHLIKKLSTLVNGEPLFLPAPGITPKKSLPDFYTEDEYVKIALDMFNQLTVAVVGIGAMQPSELLSNSGNFFQPDELGSLKQIGAVGDICLHFFDETGKPIRHELQNRVIGMNLGQLKKVPRTIGVAGGRRKADSIRAALKGGYLDVLVTDHITAEIILENWQKDKN